MIQQVTKPLVMIIDDEAELLELVESEVKRWGYNTVTAHNAIAATRLLNQVDSVTPHAILCDINMPKISGIEFLYDLRSKGCDIPFVFLTGHGDYNSVVSAVRLGAIDFINKPINFKELAEVVEKAVEIGSKNMHMLAFMEKLKVESPQSGAELEMLIADRKLIEKLRAFSMKKTAA